MKTMIIMIILCLSALSHGNDNYDPELAQTLGADDYGMKT